MFPAQDLDALDDELVMPPPRDHACDSDVGLDFGVPEGFFGGLWY
jgi:hypothetical protein